MKPQQGLRLFCAAPTFSISHWRGDDIKSSNYKLNRLSLQLFAALGNLARSSWISPCVISAASKIEIQSCQCPARDDRRTPETQGERMKSTKRRGDEFYTTIKVILSVLIWNRHLGLPVAPARHFFSLRRLKCCQKYFHTTRSRPRHLKPQVSKLVSRIYPMCILILWNVIKQ